LKQRRVTIVQPLYLELLYKLKKDKFKGICANRWCLHPFSFKGSFVIKKMRPHIKECRKREEKRGSYPWIDHFCEKCEKKFQWDVPIYIRVNGDDIQFHSELQTKKHLGPINWKNCK